MIGRFLYELNSHFSREFGNTLFNGMASDLSSEDKAAQVGVKLQHFIPINDWSVQGIRMIDKSTEDRYFNETARTVRLKCAAAFGGSLIIQPIGLTLNLLNKIGKIVTFAHFRNPNVRFGEWVKDLSVVVSTPLILIGLLFSSLYGATFSPYDGRKLYGTCERFAYSGGYKCYGDDLGRKTAHDYILAPCFQPEAKSHLFGGKPGGKDSW